MSERISIIIPVLNEADIITGALNHLQHLRAAGHEIIVADGGSTDNTVALAALLTDHIVHSKQGRARQMNAGARAARGDILLFLHADTALPAQADKLIMDGGLGGSRRWGRFNVRLSGRQLMLRLVETMMNLRSRLSDIATGDQAIFVERALFEQIGGFPEIALMEDIALSRLLKRHSPPFCIATPVVTSSRRWEQRGILRTICLMWWLRLAYFFGADPQRLGRAYYR